MDTLTSVKGYPLIIVDGYLLKMNYVKQHSFDIFWRCTNHNCKAGVFTRCNNQITQVKNEHNHERHQLFPKIVMSDNDKRKAMIDMLNRQDNKRKRRVLSHQSATVTSTISPLVRTPLPTIAVNDSHLLALPAGQVSKERCMDVCCNSNLYLYNTYDCFMQCLNQYISKYISTKIVNNEPIDLDDYHFCKHYQQELLKILFV